MKSLDDPCTRVFAIHVKVLARVNVLCKQFSTSHGVVGCHTTLFVMYYTSIDSVFKPLSSCYSSSWEVT